MPIFAERKKATERMEIGYLRELSREVQNLARWTGRRIHEKRGTLALQVSVKGPHDYVTQLDRECEAELVSGLGELLPEAGFVCEEGSGGGPRGELNWVVDPIDGTTNFIHSHPPYCISIALREGSAVVLGVVYEMSRDELFSAVLGGGAELDGAPIHVSDTPLPQALVATGFPYTDFSRQDPYMEVLCAAMRATAGVRRMGSAAADLAYVAAGRYDAFYEYGLHPWDVAAGALLVAEAGGQVTDFGGGDKYIDGAEMVATNAACGASFRKLLAPLTHAR